MAELKFDIVHHIGVLSEGNKGWKREINLVSWNERTPKIDIRDWDENHAKMSKGITMTFEEFIDLKDILETIDMADIRSKIE
ncbi:MAG: PC4/YdbC family ssDNA-binding protein [Candidatus Muirbacterium halophilum]|nr:PC4/YdbC family ssDNA-binding protein [Candidatus Muirbacterium halophilum]MCK9477574.1 PC4/YdbC family ssDNA-binding protein [Candidatus Muirbacterium halophilum]